MKVIRINKLIASECIISGNILANILFRQKYNWLLIFGELDHMFPLIKHGNNFVMVHYSSVIGPASLVAVWSELHQNAGFIYVAHSIL